MPDVVKTAVTEALPSFIEAHNDIDLAPLAVRIAAAFSDQDDFKAVMSVITSYSIHYTKLYEEGPCRFLGAMCAPRSSGSAFHGSVGARHVKYGP